MTQTKSLEDVFREICARDGPLKQRLDDFSQAVRELSPEFATAYDDLVTRLQSGEAGAGAPEPGDPMPSFILPDTQGRLVSLANLIQSGPAVISFNRGHWCEYCAIELSAFSQAMTALTREGASVVSIMPETRAFTAKARVACGERFEILSDIENGYALECGLAIWLGDRVREICLAHGLHLQKYQGTDAWFLPIPATFVVRRDGLIAARFVDPDFRRRMEMSDIAEIVARLGRTGSAGN